jgi:hypothetical protein
MKRLFILISVILLSLIFTSICKGDVIVSPPEISIKMDNEFINGNTSKKITIINNNDYEFNMTWYLENPNPMSWMRPNRTYMPDLSWIDLKPRWNIIPPHSSANFYIYLSIPESSEYLNRHWETWITFKQGTQESGGGMFNQEYAIRTYIDTPQKVEISNNPNNDLFSITIGDKIKISVSDIIILAAISTTLAIVYIAIRNKKS